MKLGTALRIMSFWPPYMGAGISIVSYSKDFTSIDVKMKQRFWNKNYVGTHFGGSLYAMADPFYMLILMENLGRDYIIWDKAATIRFIKPGRGTVYASFRVSQEQIAEIKKQADTEHKLEPVFSVQVLDESGDLVAEVDKVIYIRRKRIKE